VIGGGILEGGKEHAARQMTVTDRRRSFQSEIVFKLSTPGRIVRIGIYQTGGAKAD
jgi:hypothetical protein